MIDCKTCAAKSYCAYAGCDFVIDECGIHANIALWTNADRIRNMSDEELSEWFVAIQDDMADYYNSCSAQLELPTTGEAWLKWLKQEVNNNVSADG